MDDPLNGVVQGLLDQLNAGFPRVENMTGPQARAAVAERCMPVSNLDDVRCATDRVVPGPDGAVPVRIYEPHGAPSGDRAAIVFYHGGGFVFCDIESHDGFCRALVRGTQAVVVSARDGEGLEKPVAHVVLAAAHAASAELEAELIAFCRDGLPSVKRPRKVVFVDGYPTTATGKIRRVELREQAATVLIEPATAGLPAEPAR